MDNIAYIYTGPDSLVVKTSPSGGGGGGVEGLNPNIGGSGVRSDMAEW